MIVDKDNAYHGAKVKLSENGVKEWGFLIKEPGVYKNDVIHTKCKNMYLYIDTKYPISGDWVCVGAEIGHATRRYKCEDLEFDTIDHIMDDINNNLDKLAEKWKQENLKK